MVVGSRYSPLKAAGGDEASAKAKLVTQGNPGHVVERNSSAAPPRHDAT
jgi:hypothetical protein